MVKPKLQGENLEEPADQVYNDSITNKSKDDKLRVLSEARQITFLQM
jgi:hypothetical protein